MRKGSEREKIIKIRFGSAFNCDSLARFPASELACKPLGIDGWATSQRLSRRAARLHCWLHWQPAKVCLSSGRKRELNQSARRAGSFLVSCAPNSQLERQKAAKAARYQLAIKTKWSSMMETAHLRTIWMSACVFARALLAGLKLN